MYVVVFVGRNRPETEWSGVLSKLNVKFFRYNDPKNIWYQQEHWKNTLQELVDKEGYPALTFGSSMGGWAALKFQPILKSKSVIAFTPQTTTVPEKLLEFGKGKNQRWGEYLQSQKQPGSYIPKPDGAATLYYGNNKADSGHKEIAKQLGYKIIHVDAKTHNIANYFNEQNKLVDILKENLK